MDTLRVRFTTGGGVANGDVTAGQLWEDTNGNGTFDGAGPDTLLQGGVAPAGGVLTFTSNFSPATPARTTSCGPPSRTSRRRHDDLLAGRRGHRRGRGGRPRAGRDHERHPHAGLRRRGGDVYYSVGTSVANLKTGAPTMTISNGTASLSVAQAGYIGVGDEITYNTTFKAYIKAVLGPSTFVVHTATGGQPAGRRRRHRQHDRARLQHDRPGRERLGQRRLTWTPPTW